MQNSEEPDKKMNKAKSFNVQTTIAPSPKLKSEPGKRKSFDINDAVRSLEVANRLKKSKLVNGECITATSSPPNQNRIIFPDMFMDVSSSPHCPGIDNASLMSMNFSHYELMRNLSNTHCNSDGAFSSTTCSAHINTHDSTVRNEHLERYFRSVDMWSPRFRDEGSSGLNQPGK